MSKLNYRIIGKCPFGTGKVDENGQMNQSQFGSDDPSDYIDGTGARLAICVAQQYGGEPLCQIATDFCAIDVYLLSDCYGAKATFADGSSSVYDAVWCNTVNPLAIVNYVRQEYNALFHHAD